MIQILLLSSLLSQSPLTVRIWEQQRPTQIHLESTSIFCDKKLLTSSVDISIKSQKLVVDGNACERIATTDSFELSRGELHRKYNGTLEVSVEKGLLKLINTIEVEQYLPGVLAQESADFSGFAMQAQAIVSRTFALGSVKRHAEYDLCDLTHCQLYKGIGEPAIGVQSAVKKTAGQVLLRGGVALKPTYFHAACGGHTSSGEDVFGEVGGLGVNDRNAKGAWCDGAKDVSWSFEVERVSLSDALKIPLSDASAIQTLQRDVGGRILQLAVFGKRMSGNQFVSKMGKAFGFQSIRSAHFSVSEVAESIRFSGEGLGHGVGFCQAGAQEMSLKGKSVAQILKHYFPDSKVVFMEERSLSPH
jgi:stage II sporulation protein D